jgi:hypothetical protein
MRTDTRNFVRDVARFVVLNTTRSYALRAGFAISQFHARAFP